MTIYLATVVTEDRCPSLKDMKRMGTRTVAVALDPIHIQLLVLGNYGDINDGGMYEYAVIEALEDKDGVYPFPKYELWYEFRDGRYRLTNKPESFSNVSHFYG